MYKKHINIIANIIAINSQRILQPGLINGQLGIVIFLYYFARFSGHKQYAIMAEEILEFVINKEMKKMDRSFSNGLYGLGWCLKYLSDNLFIELDEQTLKDHNKLVLQQYTNIDLKNDVSSYIPLFSKGLYCSRLDNEKLLLQSLLAMEYIARQKTMPLGLEFLVSMKYSTNIIKEKNIFASRCENLLSILDTGINQLLAHENKCFPEKFVLSIIDNNYLLCQDDISLIDLYTSWQTIIYDDKVKFDKFISIYDLSNYLKSIISVPPDYLILGNLSALGVNLIKMST